jgi:hypothetical protein
MLVEAIIFIMIAVLISYITLSFLKRPPVYQGTKQFYDLSSRSSVMSNNDLFWTDAPCSLRFAINVTQAPRTVSKVDCIEDSNAATSFAPSCKDYSFKICKCNATDCSPCKLVDSTSGGYLSKLLSIGPNLELWASGYTSQNDKPYIPALLKIRTLKDNTQAYSESIELPAIPLQKWTVVTIVKEGRRFDVYYGAKLVTSKLCDYVPAAPGSSDQLNVGNPKWHGSIGLFVGTNKTQTTEDVLADVSNIVNTAGEPFVLSEMKFDFNVSIPECMFGNCNKMPEIKPLNPFASYITNVQ